MGRPARRIAVGAGLLLLLAACTSDGEQGDADGGAVGEEAVQDRSARLSYQGKDAGGGTTAAVDLTNPQEDSLSIGPSVIKTADMRVEVGADALQSALDDATAIASRAGGFVLSSQVDDEEHRANLVVRVPADRFEQALADLGDLGDVERQSVAGEDVSQEFIDLEARLRNASAQEAVLLRLMEGSQTIADTIRVQRELQQVQLEIERLRGRIRYLEDQTAFGTISVGFAERGAPQPSDPSTLARAWDTASETFANIVGGVVIGAAVLIPIALLSALVTIVVMVVYRRVRPRVATLFK